MKHWRFGVFAVLAAAIVAVCVPAVAATVRANLGLTQGPATCNGKGTYSYRATWSAAAKAGYQVNSGNQCKMGGSVCSISGKECNVVCTPTGLCSAEVTSCVIGKGAPWIKVTSADMAHFQQITAVGPANKCQ